MTRFCFLFLFICGSGVSSLASTPNVQNMQLENRILDIALREYDKPSRDWDPSQRDCAGLVRYIYRKALGSRKNMWLDSAGEKVNFASAEHLVNSNFHFLSHEVNESAVRSGDLLVYFSDEKESANRYHLMMMLKAPKTALQKILVVYHNGAEKPKGQIKRVWLRDLGRAAGPEWSPSLQNSHFQGVYRWREW